MLFRSEYTDRIGTKQQVGIERLGHLALMRASLRSTPVHSVAKASDGRGEITKLSERAAEYFRASNVENLIGAIYAPQMDNSRIAGFARLVVETAQDGDKVAIKILRDAGHELGTAAAAVLKKLGLEKRKVPIGCVGSVFKAGELLTGPMTEIIRRVAPKAYLTDPQMPPAHAAALMAMKNGNNGK